jgi:TRAP-type mannitol/chloroaromatic compound transport system permease small subunit
MLTTLQRIACFIDDLSERTGHAIAWLTIGTVLLTFSVVVLRYGFDSGSIAMQETVSYLHAAVFMLGAAYTLKHDGHVRVDIVYRRLSARGQALVNLLGTLLLLLPVCIYIMASSWEYVAISWGLREGSQEAGGLNAVFLLKTAIPAMAVLLMLQGIAIALHSLLQLLGVELRADEVADREL